MQIVKTGGYSPVTDSYYRIIDGAMDWAGAQAAALSSTWSGRAGHLAAIESQAEQDWIIQNLGFDGSTTCWLGLTQNPFSPSYSEPGGGWEWSTGEVVGFLNWAANEPNNTSGMGGIAEDHTEMYSTGRWNDRANVAPFPAQYLVEYSPVHYNPSNDHYYRLITAPHTWTEADVIARSSTWAGRPGHLATISDGSEQSWIQAHFYINRAMIGLFQDLGAPTYFEPGGGWSWVTGEPVTYLNWAPNEPNNTSGMGGIAEDFGEMSNSGGWNDIAGIVRTNQVLVEYSNDGLGWDYCRPAIVNSAGMPGEIRALGSLEVSANQLALEASQLPSNSLGFYLASRTQGYLYPVNNSVGALCLLGSIGRGVGGMITNSGQSGITRVTANLQAMPTPSGPVAVLPGDSWNFQYWYRDSIGGTATSNLTHAVSIRFR